VFVVILVIVLVGAALAWTLARSRRNGLRSSAANRQMLEAELSVLADDVVQLDAAVSAHPDARADYDAAVSRYRAAQAALEYATDDIGREKVERMVAEATYSMSRARAIVEGRPPPPPPVEPPPTPAASSDPGAAAGPPGVVFLPVGRRGRMGPGIGPRRLERQILRQERRRRRRSL
jgi:hypothetical protein